MKETNLERELRKYFSEVGREIIFNNGWNLSAVAGEMGDKLLQRTGKSSVDASVLSKVIRSQENRSLSPLALDILCDILGVSSRARLNLHNAAHQDYCLRHEVEVDLSISPYAVENLGDHLETVKKIRRQGNTDLAIERAGLLGFRLRNEIANNPESKALRPLKTILAHAIFEQAQAYNETNVPRTNCTYTDRVKSEMHDLAQDLDDPELYGLRLLHLGSFHYIRQEFEIAVPLFMDAEDLLIEPHHQLEVLRGLALSWANLDDEDRFAGIEMRARELIAEGNWHSLPRVCGILEGIGRALGLLGESRGFDVLRESEDLYSGLESRTEHEPLRVIQIAMSRVILAKKLERGNWQLLEEEARKALELADMYGYVRYKSPILGLLEQSLN